MTYLIYLAGFGSGFAYLLIGLLLTLAASNLNDAAIDWAVGESLPRVIALLVLWPVLLPLLLIAYRFKRRRRIA